MNILEQIIADKRLEVAERKKRRSLKDLQAEISGIGNRPDFVEALRAAPMGLIAEVKRRSPSAGLIRDPFDPAAIARDYESNGASAVSCLMDQKYFGGGDADFSAVVFRRILAHEVPIVLLRHPIGLDDDVGYMLFFILNR